MSFDHIGFNVANFEKSRDFYLAALGPLGWSVKTTGEGWVMLGEAGRGRFWLGAFGAAATPIHIAFEAATRDQVDRFYEAAMKAGGSDNGPPGLRDYSPNYYAAFVLDPDGHNIEAVCHAG